jgi:hypothetical protein
MAELLQRLKDEDVTFETALGSQQKAMEQAAVALAAQAERFEGLATDADRSLELIMANAATRTTQLTASFGREVEQLKESSENATATLAKLVNSLHDAGVGAQTLIAETASETQTSAKLLVGEAMAECQKLLRTAGELAAEAREVKLVLAATAEDVEKHVLSLPGVARQEAQRVRDLVRAETDQILDMSARTLSTIHSRSFGRTGGPAAGEETAPVAEENDGASLRGLARRLTQRPKKKENEKGDEKTWNMRTLLSAVDTNEAKSKEIKPDATASLGALQTMLSDLAIDLGAISTDAAPGEEEWRRYVAGDCTVFARRLADTIDAESVDRIATAYRENQHFHDAADLYLAEFGMLLARAREGDTSGLLASTVLSADTGKIYLAMAYALGRLES